MFLSVHLRQPSRPQPWLELEVVVLLNCLRRSRKRRSKSRHGASTRRAARGRGRPESVPGNKIGFPRGTGITLVNTRQVRPLHCQGDVDFNLASLVSGSAGVEPTVHQGDVPQDQFGGGALQGTVGCHLPVGMLGYEDKYD